MPEAAREVDVEVLRQQIAERAYALWEHEGRPHGCDLDDWLRAETEVLAAGPDQSASAAAPAGRGKKTEKPLE